jgi:hypothetical protein
VTVCSLSHPTTKKDVPKRWAGITAETKICDKHFTRTTEFLSLKDQSLLSTVLRCSFLLTL